MISGGKILDMQAKRLSDKQLENINVNVNISDLKSEKDSILLTYTYTITYAPEVAEFVVTGEMILTDDAQTPKKQIEEEWKKRKQLPIASAEMVLTAITYTATAIGTLLAFGLGITAPINIPRVKLEPPAEKKAG